MNDVTLSSDGLTITYKNTLKALLAVRAWQTTWPVEKELVDSDVRSVFAWIAPHMVKVDGSDWKPPTLTASKEEIEAAYQKFIALDQITLEFIRESDKAVDRLHAPLSDVLQRPDESLTPQEAQDPNS